MVASSLPTKERNLWIERAVELLWEAVPADPRQPQSWAGWTRLLPHVMVVVEHAQHAQVALKSTAGLLTNAGIYLCHRAEFVIARDALQQALTIFEMAYGPDHPQVAITLNNLGIAFLELGNPTAAQERFERALAINGAAYGHNHPQVAITLTNLGNALRELGDLIRAKQPWNRRYPSLRRSTDPTTLRSLAP